MSELYRVKDWDTHFENSESRKIKSLTWLPVKNKHDGKGYRRVCNHPKSVQVFCAWSLILQVASKMPARGVLRDEDGPLTTSDLSFKTGYPEHIFREAFQVLTDPKIGWLVREQIPASPETSGAVGTEWNRTEGKGTEQTSPLEAEKRGVTGGKNREHWQLLKDEKALMSRIQHETNRTRPDLKLVESLRTQLRSLREEMRAI